jgi:hypothetical protein
MSDITEIGRRRRDVRISGLIDFEKASYLEPDAFSPGRSIDTLIIRENGCLACRS